MGLELIKALTNNSPQVRGAAAIWLGTLKTQDPAATSGLTRALNDPDAEVRKSVLRAFFLANPDSQQFSNAALAQLDDSAAAVRLQAIQFLARIRPDSREAKNRLIACSTDRNFIVRRFALENYRRLGLDSADLLRMAENYVSDSDPAIRLALTEQLSDIARQNPEARTLLQRCLEDRSVAEAYLGVPSP